MQQIAVINYEYLQNKFLLRSGFGYLLPLLMSCSYGREFLNAHTSLSFAVLKPHEITCFAVFVLLFSDFKHQETMTGS